MASGNKLGLNLIKTQATVVGSRPNLEKVSAEKVQPPTFVIGDSQIETFEKAKCLEVQPDKHLAWDEHVRFVYAKVFRSLGFLKYVKKLLPQESLSHIYRGIVEHYSVTIGLCGGAVGKPVIFHCRSYKIVLQE